MSAPEKENTVKRMLSKSVVLSIGVGAFGLTQYAVSAPPRVSVTDRGTVPGRQRSMAHDINARGLVGDTASGEFHVKHPTGQTTVYEFTTIVVPDGTSYGPFGINDRGQIMIPAVPRVSILGVLGGYLYDRGEFSPIYVPGTPRFVFLSGINDRGQIVGHVGSDVSGQLFHGVLYDRGEFSTIEFPGAVSTFLYGINNRGQIVGDYFDAGFNGGNFLYDRGEFSTIDFPGGTVTVPKGINDRGQIVGSYCDDNAGCHGYLYDRGEFSTIDFPGGESTSPHGINDRGQIVGSYYSQGYHGFLDDNGDLSTIDFPGASDTLAYGINDRGQVVGNYFLFGAIGPYVFLATPQHDHADDRGEARHNIGQAAKPALSDQE